MSRMKVSKGCNHRSTRISRRMIGQVKCIRPVKMTKACRRFIDRLGGHPRAGWKASFAKMAEKGDDRLLDENLLTRWDEIEWLW